MELKEDFLKNQSDDIRNSANNDVSAGSDSIGENSGNTPVASTQQDAEKKGWENNKPGVTSDNQDDPRITTVTPQNEGTFPGPEDDDFGDEDDDDDELIPVETDDDDDFLIDDEDDDDDDIVDEHPEPPHKEHGHHHIDISHVVPSENRPFGRSSGRMIDHEPGTS